jgi:RNA polymerase sigma factor (sigma-70 family)
MDEQQLDTLMKSYTAQLFRVAYYYTKNLHTAEDIVQEIFLKFYQTKLTLEGNEIERYLMKMTANKAKDYLRSWHYRKLVLQDKWLASKKVQQQDALILLDEEEMISYAVLSLPLKQREVVAYFYLEGLSVKQVSELLQVNENTVKSRLAKGRELLKKSLQSIEWEVLKNDTL